jgi:Fe2+ transport system protein FeoA
VNVSIAALKPGQCARIVELRCVDLGRLDRLGAFGLVPGSLVRLRQSRPALIIEIGETVLSMDHAVAADILVQPS